jgi:predicted double-glycine peptidase
LVLVFASRLYAEHGGPLWWVAERFAHAGKWYAFAVVTMFGFGYAASASRLPRTHVVALVGTAVCVFVVVWKTCPVYLFLDPTPTRDERGILRQSTQATCGPVALANALELRAGRSGVTERVAARWCGTTSEGTTRWGLLQAARAEGFTNAWCAPMTFEQLETCGSPAIVSISTMPGVRHATLIVELWGDLVLMVDPAYGRMGVTKAWLRQCWYGMPIVLEAPAERARIAARRARRREQGVFSQRRRGRRGEVGGRRWAARSERGRSGKLGRTEPALGAVGPPFQVSPPPATSVQSP